MKVGLYLQTWHVGGVAVFCERLAAGLAKLGHAPCLVLSTPFGKRDRAGREAFERLQARQSFPVRCLHLHAYHPRERGWRAADKLAALGFEAVIASSHREIAAGLAELGRTTAVIGVAHNDDADTYAEFDGSQDHCDAYVAVSATILDELAARKPSAAKVQLRRIWCGVPAANPAVKSSQNTPARILVVGRLEHQQKRVLDLPEIWRRYLDAGGTGRLSIGGTGGDEAKLRQALQKEIDRGTVRWIGCVPADEMPTIYAEHDILLSVSAYEGFPLAVLEAARAGLYPVLSRTRSGHPEIVTALGAGTLCEVGDHAAFAAALPRSAQELLHVRELAPQIRRRADELFSLERMAREYANLLEESLRARATRPARPPSPLIRPKVDPLRRILRRWKYSRHYGWQK